MNEHTVSRLLRSILSELQYWRKSELIHMDIKSSNILITIPSDQNK